MSTHVGHLWQHLGPAHDAQGRWIAEVYQCIICWRLDYRRSW